MSFIDPVIGCAFATTPQADLRGHLAGLVDGRDVALFDWPDYANAGDHFIWLGQKILLKEAAAGRVLYEASLKTFDFRKLCNLPADCVLIMQGGGNFGDLYPYHQRFREAIVAGFPERRIIFMPQSAWFADAAALRRSRRILSGHRDLHVFARDRRSLRLMRHRLGIRHTRLGIDAAFFLSDIVRQIQARFPDAGAGRVRLLRQDGEAFGGQPTAKPAGDVKDWASADDLRDGEGDALFDLTRCGLHAARAFRGELDAASWRRLCGAIALLASADEIVTDRLHAHILCVMMGKPHVMLDTIYGKLGDFHATWEKAHQAGRLDSVCGFAAAVRQRFGFSRAERRATDDVR